MILKEITKQKLIKKMQTINCKIAPISYKHFISKKTDKSKG